MDLHSCGESKLTKLALDNRKQVKQWWDL